MIINATSIFFTLVILAFAFTFGLKFVRQFALQIVRIHTSSHSLLVAVFVGQNLTQK